MEISQEMKICVDLMCIKKLTETSLIQHDRKIHKIYFKLVGLHTSHPSLTSTLLRELSRSASHNFLHVPFTSTAVGHKAFRYAAPTVWNSIPFNIRHSPFIGSFKRHLKTYLFTLPG